MLIDAIEVVRKSTPASPAVTAEALANAENFNVEARLMKAEVKLKSYDGLFTDALCEVNHAARLISSVSAR